MITIKVFALDSNEPFTFNGDRAMNFYSAYLYACENGNEWFKYQYEEIEQSFNLNNIVSVLKIGKALNGGNR